MLLRVRVHVLLRVRVHVRVRVRVRVRVCPAILTDLMSLRYLVKLIPLFLMVVFLSEPGGSFYLYFNKIVRC